MIHENQEQAKNACKKYVEAIYDLQSKFGVWEENEDSCSPTSTYARYKTESGETKVYSPN